MIKSKYILFSFLFLSSCCVYSSFDHDIKTSVEDFFLDDGSQLSLIKLASYYHYAHAIMSDKGSGTSDTFITDHNSGDFRIKLAQSNKEVEVQSFNKPVDWETEYGVSTAAIALNQEMWERPRGYVFEGETKDSILKGKHLMVTPPVDGKCTITYDYILLDENQVGRISRWIQCTDASGKKVVDATVDTYHDPILGSWKE